MAEPGITQTDVLKLNKPDKGYFDWDVPLNENWDKLDQLGAGQLPLMTPLDLTYKLSGAALLGWGLAGDFVDANIYTSLWDLCWAARQRAGEPTNSKVVYGKTFYLSRDSVTGLYFTTEDSYNRGVTEIGSSLGMICEYDAAADKKTLRLPLDAWLRKPITDYNQADAALSLPGYNVDESLPNIRGQFYGEQNALTGGTGAFYNGNNPYGGRASGNLNNLMRFDASRSNSTYKDNAWVQPRAHASYRYYKIGNTIQNQGMIDVGELTSAVSELETEVSRINTVMDTKLTSKLGLIKWNSPTRVSLAYTASYPGLLWVALNTGEDNTQRFLRVNNVEAAFVMGRYSRSGGDSNAYLFLSPGDVVTNPNGANIIRCVYWPFVT